MKNNYQYWTNCINAPRSHVDPLIEMVERGRTITRETFMRRIGGDNYRQLERDLGYDENLRMKDDACVSYAVGRMGKERVYYANWSAIEYMFTPNGVAPAL